MQTQVGKNAQKLQKSCSLLCEIDTNHTLYVRCAYSTSPSTYFGFTPTVIRNQIYFSLWVTILRVSSLLWFIWTQHSKWLMNMGSTLLRRHVSCVHCVFMWMKYHIVIFQDYLCTQCFFFLPQRSTGKKALSMERGEKGERIMMLQCKNVASWNLLFFAEK